MSTLPSTPADLRAKREAAAWLVKHDRGLTPAEQDEFFQWLSADAQNGAWLTRHRASWARLDTITAWRPAHSAVPNPNLLDRAGPRIGRPRAIALAVAAVVFVGMAGWWLRVGPVGSEMAASGPRGYERRTLDDGTVAELNGSAAIEVNFTETERRVVLRQGEALFTVTKNERRPFIVRANGVDVRAVGTAFNVRMDRSEVEVIVTEGTVELAEVARAFHSVEHARATPPVDRVTTMPLVAAGYRAVVNVNPAAPASTAIIPTTETDLARLRAWQPQLLDFSSTPLADVLAEFNRRNRVQLRLGDAGLGRIPIVASIRSDNIDGFVRLVAATAHLRAEQRGDYEIVLRPAGSE